MENVKIKKANIREGLFLYVEFTEELQGHNRKENKINSTVPIHEDLKNSFDALHRHLAILCDEVNVSKKSEFSELVFPAFDARGFTIGGSTESGVTISGSKDGKYGTVNLNTPFTKYDESEYPYMPELTLDIEACIYEVEQYLFEGKRAPEKQIAIEFPEEMEVD